MQNGRVVEKSLYIFVPQAKSNRPLVFIHAAISQ